MNAGTSSVDDVRILPLARTRVDDRSGCVGAVDATGRWLRPEPVLASDLEGGLSPFRYFRWVDTRLAPSGAADARPEDRSLVGVGTPGASLAEDERARLLLSCRDASAEEVFGAGRSLGLVEAVIKDLYCRRSTGGRVGLRIVFEEGSGGCWDWPLPELDFRSALLPYAEGGNLADPIRSAAVAALRQRRVFLTVGLTKPMPRFPGHFGGCHPLVVGVHCLPALQSPKLVPAGRKATEP